MGHPAEQSEARAIVADRGVVGFPTAGASNEVLASDPFTQEIDQASLAALVKFFQLLAQWHREANSPC